MPCRFVARGESLGLLIPDGSMNLRQIIDSALNKVGSNITGRVEGIVSLGEGDCEFSVEVSNGKVVMVCVDCGEEFLGDEAVSKLRRILEERPSRGYVEVVKLSDAAVGLDMDSAPRAGLKQPITLSELLTAGSEGARSDVNESEGNEEVLTDADENGLRAYSSEDAELPHQETRQGKEVNGIKAPTSASSDIVKSSPEVFLASIVVHSKPIDISTNGSRLTPLLNKAKELSLSRSDKVYRLAVSLKSGETINAFFHDGKPCILLKHNSLYNSVMQLKPDVDEHLGKLPRDNIKYILLCEVTDPLIVRSVENSCTPFPTTSAVKVPERGTRKGRRGFLSRILRR